MFRYICLSLLVALLLSACGAAATEPPATNEQGLPLVTVYRAPT